MKLTFHDRSSLQAPVGSLLFTISKPGKLTLNKAATSALKIKPSQLVLLVNDEQNNWYVLFSPPATFQPYVLLTRNNSDLYFNSSSLVEAYYKANEVDAAQRSVKLHICPEPITHEGLKLYKLQGRPNLPVTHRSSRIARQAKPLPALGLAKPDEATLYRLNETVRTLAGMQLHKREAQELHRALGLLSQHEAWVATIAGGAGLLTKLRTHLHA